MPRTRTTTGRLEVNMVTVETPRLSDNWPNFHARSPLPEEIVALRHEVEHLDRELFLLQKQRLGSEGAFDLIERNMGYCKRQARLPKSLLDILQSLHREVHKAHERQEFEAATANLRLAQALLDQVETWGHETLYFAEAGIALTTLDQKQRQVSLMRTGNKE